MYMSSNKPHTVVCVCMSEWVSTCASEYVCVRVYVCLCARACIHFYYFFLVLSVVFISSYVFNCLSPLFPSTNTCV